MYGYLLVGRALTFFASESTGEAMRAFNHEHAISSRVEYADGPDGLFVPHRLIIETDLPMDATNAEYQSRVVSDLEIKASAFARSACIAEVVFVRKV